MLKYIFSLLLTSLTLLTVFQSCKKEPTPTYNPNDKWGVPPSSFYFQVTENGVPLITDTFNNEFKMYYIDKEGKKVLDPGKNLDDPRWVGGYKETDEVSDIEYVVMVNPYIPNMYEMKSWFLEYKDGTIDTLIVFVDNLSTSDAKQHPCYCKHPVKSVLFNGEWASIHPTLRTGHDRDIYVLDRKR